MSTNILNDSRSHELRLLLKKSSADLYEQEQHLYDQMAGPFANSLVLFGAGGLGKKTLYGLRKHGIEPLAFTDNNVNLHGKQVGGLTVLPPKVAAEKYGASALFIVTVYTEAAPGGSESIIKKLHEAGCQRVISFVPLYWKYADELLPHYVIDLPHKIIESSSEILDAFALFQDPASREEFLAQIHWRLNPSYYQVPPQATHRIYFPPDLYKLKENEVFIDCGAYNGDTIQSFIEQTNGLFEGLIAFEPDPNNFQKMAEMVGSLPNDIAKRIRISQMALDRTSRQLHFDAQGVASSSFSEGGDILIQCEPLDKLLGAEKSTFIKMDIEGAELDALYGSVEQISRNKPILAISAYHTQDHIWRLPLLIQSFSGSYRFFLRRYTPKFLDDLVLYAIPEDRRQYSIHS